MKSIPLFKFPATVLFVDDDLFLLESFEDFFGENYRVLTTVDPDNVPKILSENETINKQDFISNITDDIKKNLHSGLRDLIVTAFDFESIIKIIDSSDNISDVGVIVVDYQMPITNGLECCRNILTSKAKRILLTGEDTGPEAISAFNSGLIDVYVKKGRKNTLVDLEFYISELMNQYFIELTKTIQSNLESSGVELLSDVDFVVFFNKIIKQFDIIKHCLINRNGSFLLIDRKNKKRVLNVVDDECIEELLNFFEKTSALSPEVPAYLLKSIANRESLPFFGLREDISKYDLTAWINHLHPCAVVKCNKTYYWNIIEI